MAQFFLGIYFRDVPRPVVCVILTSRGQLRVARARFFLFMRDVAGDVDFFAEWVTDSVLCMVYVLETCLWQRYIDSTT